MTMAAIEKMYFNRDDAKTALNYLHSIDREFTATFSNASSLLDYCYAKSNEEIDNWIDNLKENYPDAKEEEFTIPLTNFPTPVDKWLYQRTDCPQLIKDTLLNWNYDNNHEMLMEPLSSELIDKSVKRATKFKVIHIQGTVSKHAIYKWNHNNRRRRKKGGYNLLFEKYPSKELTMEYVGHPINSYVDVNMIDNATPIVGCKFISLSYHGKPIMSVKALIRRMRNWNFPVGTTLEIEDNFSTILIKCY